MDNSYGEKMFSDASRNLKFKRDSAIAQNNPDLTAKLNLQLTKLDDKISTECKSLKSVKSTRFRRPKTRNVSQTSPSIGYAKPVQQQKISNKYQCMVSGVKRMEPCSGCSNPKGCLSNSMQYKERD